MVRRPHVQLAVPDGWGLISHEGPLMWAPLDATPDALQVSVPRLTHDQLGEAFAELTDPPVFPGSSIDAIRTGACAYGHYATCRIVGAPVKHFHLWLLMSRDVDPVMVTWESDRPITDDVHRIVLGIRPASPLPREFVNRVFSNVEKDLSEYGEVPIKYVIATSNQVTIGTVGDGAITAEVFATVVDHVRSLAANASEAALFLQMLVRDPDTGEVLREGVEVFLASRDRRERWWLPVTTDRGAPRLGSPTELDFGPSHPAYVFFPLPYRVVHGTTS